MHVPCHLCTYARSLPVPLMHVPLMHEGGTATYARATYARMHAHAVPLSLSTMASYHGLILDGTHIYIYIYYMYIIYIYVFFATLTSPPTPAA